MSENYRPSRQGGAVRMGFLRSIPRVEIFCDGMSAYALHVLKAEGNGWEGEGFQWYCSRCGARVKVVT